MKQKKYDAISAYMQRILDATQLLELECEDTEIHGLAIDVAGAIQVFEEAFAGVSIEHTFYTNAPEAYDYGYVRTVRRLEEPKSNGSGWREIAVTDQYRFENFQTPRYGSGLYQVVTDVKEIYPELPEYQDAH